MRTMFLTTVSVVALTGAAMAADPAPLLNAPTLQTPAWAGPYIGVHAGRTRHRGISDNIEDPILVVDPGYDGSVSRTGFTGGVHAGYNWQNHRLVYGIEADLSSMPGEAKEIYGPALFSTAETFTSRIKWLSTYRGRAGVVFGDALVYATAGLAVGRVSNLRSDLAVLGFAAQEDTTRAGLVFGAGVEYMFARNWTARVEALYVDLGNSEQIFSQVGALPAAYRTRFSNDATMVRGGISLKW